MLDPHQLFLCFVRVTGLGIGDEVVVGPPNGLVCHIRHAPSGGGLQITHEETLFLGTRKFKINLRGSNKYVVILNII